MICGEHSLVNCGTLSGVAISLRCRSWGCEHCREERRAQLVRLAAAGQPNRLLTLTINPKVCTSPVNRAHLLAEAWRLIVKRAKRAFKMPSIEYLAVFEATKRGEPHLHILLRCGFLPQRWLSEQMRDIADSPIVDIRTVSSPKRAASYIAKYLGKQPHKFGTCKRYWCTHAWKVDEPDEEKEEWQPPGKWEVCKRPVIAVAENWLAFGKAVEVEGPDLAYYGEPPPWARRRSAEEVRRLWGPEDG